MVHIMLTNGVKLSLQIQRHLNLSLLVATLGCSSGDSGAPTAPHPIAAPSPAQPDLAPDGFMDMYAFNASDWRDGTGEHWERLYLQTKRPRLGTVSPRFSPEFRAHVERTFDRFVKAFTGGLLPDGGPAIDVLTFHPDEGVPASCVGFCGCAPPSRVHIDEGGVINMAAYPDSPKNGQPCATFHPIDEIWAHELGHVMGFAHVYQGGPHNSVLGAGASEPTRLDRLHGELAYCLGDGTSRDDALDPATQPACYSP